jgi:hypothetical protein
MQRTRVGSDGARAERVGAKQYDIRRPAVERVDDLLAGSIRNDVQLALALQRADRDQATVASVIAMRSDTGVVAVVAHHCHLVRIPVPAIEEARNRADNRGAGTKPHRASGTTHPDVGILPDRAYLGLRRLQAK